MLKAALFGALVVAGGAADVDLGNLDLEALLQDEKLGLSRYLDNKTIPDPLTVINGRVTSSGQWEGAVLLTRSTACSAFCSAVFISPTVLMSAAHCCVQQSMTVCQGKNRNNLRAIATSQRVQNFGAGANDFCLVTLPRAVTNVPIYEVATNVPTGNAVIVGYGQNRPSNVGGGGGGTQREGLVTVSSVSGVDIRVNARSSGTYQNACHGDSGGPIYVNKAGTNQVQVAGVTSRGTQGCPIPTTAIYTSAIFSTNQNAIRNAGVTPGNCQGSQCCYGMNC